MARCAALLVLAFALLAGFYALAMEKPPESVTCTVVKTAEGELLQVTFRDLTLTLPAVQIDRGAKTLALKPRDGMVFVQSGGTSLTSKKITVDLVRLSITLDGVAGFELQK